MMTRQVSHYQTTLQHIYICPQPHLNELDTSLLAFPAGQKNS
jgi:hypothetical protein